MTTIKLLEAFVTAIISTMGAFVPVLILMYAHYLLRNNNYKKKAVRFKLARDGYEKLLKINEDAIRNVYKSTGVSNFQELLTSSATSGRVGSFSFIKLVDFVRGQLKEKTDTWNNMTKLDRDITYIERYDFKVYLSTLLDKRFPDRHFE